MESITSLLIIALSSALVSNVILSQFLGGSKQKQFSRYGPVSKGCAVAKNIPKEGISSPAARCMVPVSLVSKKRHRLNMALKSTNPVFPHNGIAGDFVYVVYCSAKGISFCVPKRTGHSL